MTYRPIVTNPQKLNFQINDVKSENWQLRYKVLVGRAGEAL